ncbi:MAG: S8 family serine peptidase [Elusimicrobia bacterium]|nr:S8 family serine peptidase [Elusimicrobiota bacterium]
MALWLSMLGGWARSEPGLDPALHGAIARHGSLLGVGLRPDGGLRYERVDPRTGAPSAETLSAAAAGRVARLLLRLEAGEPEERLAAALHAYLAPRLKPGEAAPGEFLAVDAAGRRRLTALGRAVLMDILTAEDGRRLEPPPGPGLAVASPLDPADERLAASRAALERATAGGEAFDGAPHAVAASDWDRLGQAVVSGARSRDPAEAVLQGYAMDRGASTLRVLIAAGRSVKSDRFQVGGARDGERALREAGLDARLLSRHGATVVRAIDNLVAVDVPLSQAAALGKALRRRGLASAPARLIKPIRAAAGPAASSAAAAWLGGQLSPIPTQALAEAAGPGGGPESLNRDSRAQLRLDGLHQEGMAGEGAVIGVIDTGIDEAHPDFQGRIVDYADFTDEGKKDAIGHGTHVSGSAAGSGAASEGRYGGAAPKARLVVAKVFGVKGEASEDVILAAMKWMSAAKEKPDVVNMSLGGPGAPNVDPLGSMANQMMIRDNILVVAAAGNEGPGPGSVGAPGNARYVLTVTGVNGDGGFPFFPSRGPVEHGDDSYAKPDLAAVAGDVNLPAMGELWAEVLRERRGLGPASAQGGAEPADPSCIYGPGVVSARSADDPDTRCALAGNPLYRYMTGTSMAAPMAAGIGADVIGYLKAHGAEARAVEVKAAMVETAADLGQAREVQGAGLADGTALAQAVAQRVRQGIPIGNIAYALALRLTTQDRQALARQERYRETALGLLDAKTGHLVNTDTELDAAARWIRANSPKPPPPAPAPPLLLLARDSRPEPFPAGQPRLPR